MDRLNKLLKVRAGLLTAQLICGEEFPSEGKQVLLSIESHVRANVVTGKYREILAQDRSRRSSTQGMIDSGKIKINQKQDLASKIGYAKELLDGKTETMSAVG
jgi:hypothetical protein